MVINNNDDESLTSSGEIYIFLPLLNAPNLDDLEDELLGKRTEPLSDIVALHPTSMKDTILRHSIKMLDKREKLAQKVEAQRKLNTKSDDGKFYIHGSLRTKNKIEVPGYLKGNEI